MKLQPSVYTKFKELQELYPTIYPVTLRADQELKRSGCHGMISPTLRNGEVVRLTIRINPGGYGSQSTDYILGYEMEILAHEYAHALAWPVDGGLHSPIWGVHYAEMYRALIDE